MTDAIFIFQFYPLILLKIKGPNLGFLLSYSIWSDSYFNRINHLSSKRSCKNEHHKELDSTSFPSFYFVLDGVVTPTQKIDGRPKKPRRHTTGGSTKEAQEDILIAKQIAEMKANGGKVVNELGQEIDPNSTLGRRQLIGMLKQRYGADIENYRSSIPAGEKVRSVLFIIQLFGVVFPSFNVLQRARPSNTILH